MLYIWPGPISWWGSISSPYYSYYIFKRLSFWQPNICLDSHPTDFVCFLDQFWVDFEPWHPVAGSHALALSGLRSQRSPQRSWRCRIARRIGIPGPLRPGSPRPQLPGGLARWRALGREAIRLTLRELVSMKSASPSRWPPLSLWVRPFLALNVAFETSWLRLVEPS